MIAMARRKFKPKVVPFPKPMPAKAIIEAMQDVVDMATRGEIISCAFVYEYRRGQTGFQFAKDKEGDTRLLIFQLEALKHWLIERINAQGEAVPPKGG